MVSNDGCKPCVERVNLAINLYPEAASVRNDVAESENLEHFNEITEIIGDIFIPLPLFGVFEGGYLKVIVAGGLSAESWKEIVEEDVDGVPVYVNDGAGRQS